MTKEQCLDLISKATYLIDELPIGNLPELRDWFDVVDYYEDVDYDEHLDRLIELECLVTR